MWIYDDRSRFKEANMRELAVKIKFSKHCLGNVRRYLNHGSKKQTYFAFQRSPDGRVMFLPRGWRANMLFATKLMNRHQSEVDNICFDPHIDGSTRPVPLELYKRYYSPERFVKHEVFNPGDIIGLNVALPDCVTDEDFWYLMDTAGRYKGISPAMPTEYGYFTVEHLVKRYMPIQAPRIIELTLHQD